MYCMYVMRICYYMLFGCQLVADSLQGMVGFQSAGRLQLRCSQEEARTVAGERAVGYVSPVEITFG